MQYLLAILLKLADVVLWTVWWTLFVILFVVDLVKRAFLSLIRFIRK